MKGRKMNKAERLAKQDEFLKAYEMIATVTGACRASGMSRPTHYHWLKTDEAYAERFQESDEIAVDKLEQEARRRAMVGVDEPVFYKGEKIDVVRKYSDVLLIFLLKGARPHKYRDVVEQRHKLDLSKLSNDELLELERLRRKLA